MTSHTSRPRVSLALGFLLLSGACAEPQPSLDFRPVPADAIRTPFPGLDFTEIREIVQTEDAIWVLDVSPPFLTRIERTTGSVVRGGSRGEGPADFLFPVALQVDPADGAAHVWDLALQRHSVFDAALSLVSSESIRADALRVRRDFRQVSYTNPHRIRKTKDGVLVVRTPARMDFTTDLLSGSLVHADPTLSPHGELVRFGEHVEPVSGDPGEFVATPLWDACGSDLILWQPRSHALAWLDQDGTASVRVPVPGRASPTTDEDIATYLEEMARLEIGSDYAKAELDFMALARGMRGLFSDHLPFVTEVFCGGGGEAWLRVFDNRDNPLGHGRRWLRISRRGTVDAIEFPAVFEPVAVTVQGLLGSFESPDGLRWLAEWTE